MRRNKLTQDRAGGLAVVIALPSVLAGAVTRASGADPNAGL